MTREKFIEKIEKLKEVLEEVENALQHTNIPIYVLVNYIRTETGINIEK